MPDNPLLTSDQNDLTAIQKCGHGSFVETQNGEWYMAHLCSRPNSARGSLLGRETALQKITWQDGWPRLACDYLLIHFASRNRTDAACFDVPICDAVFNDAQCRFDALGLHQLPAHA